MSADHVITMWDYYDGPRVGVATYEGTPHVYFSLGLDIDSDADDVFSLAPIDQDTLALVEEDWAIWLRWEQALKRGETTAATHPALPEDRARHDELVAALDARLPAGVRGHRWGDPLDDAESRFPLRCHATFTWTTSSSDPEKRQALVQWRPARRQ